MPVILRWNGHRFLFYSKEVGEPPHIHVLKDNKQLKIWLADMRIAKNVGFAAHESQRDRQGSSPQQAEIPGGME